MTEAQTTEAMFDAAGAQGIKADLRTGPHGTQVARDANELTRHHPLARSLIVTPSALMIIGQNFGEVMCRGRLSQAAWFSLNERDRRCVEIGTLNVSLSGEMLMYCRSAFSSTMRSIAVLAKKTASQFQWRVCRR